ncbi:uncharacterized protein [Drosophila pseudoobscura]|uniref:Uncharacterized protein n=1 Tax=Drosophila pseudoobscura pseudoobscura TaxID=46245 RepID=A0A6I8V111_DROPS|nr:uncharacterized protein LOC6899905 [Drosophila pseudoobscura]
MNIRRCCQLIIPVLLWAWYLRAARATRSLQIESHKCDYNGKYIESFNVSVVENRISCELLTKVRIPSAVKFHMGLERGAGPLGPYNSFFQYDIDYCKTVGSYRKTLFKKWILSVVKRGQFPRRCPWAKGTYSLRDWELSDELIPQFIVSGHYRSKIITHLGSLGRPTYEMLVECVIISQLI